MHSNALLEFGFDAATAVRCATLSGLCLHMRSSRPSHLFSLALNSLSTPCFEMTTSLFQSALIYLADPQVVPCILRLYDPGATDSGGLTVEKL